VAYAIVNSTEAQTDVLKAYYLAILGRPAASAELVGPLRSLQQGSTLDAVLIALLSSSEYAHDVSVGIR
jgi:hypothetical protein